MCRLRRRAQRPRYSRRSRRLVTVPRAPDACPAGLDSTAGRSLATPGEDVVPGEAAK